MISSPSESSEEPGNEAEAPSTRSESAKTSFSVKVRDHNENDVKPMEVEPGEEPKPEPMIPERVQEALSKATSFTEFKAARTFNVLHLFAGKRDVLGEAIKRLAEIEGMKVDLYSIDTEIDPSFNLMNELPYMDILDDARGGKFDAAHAGPPCGSFSRVRVRPGGPPPVRSLRFIYGLPTNTALCSFADRLKSSGRSFSHNDFDVYRKLELWRTPPDLRMRKKDRVGHCRRS